MRIGLTYDLRSDWLALGHSEEDVAEFDSEETIDLLDQAIRELGHETVRIGHARALCGRLVAGERWDLVFNIAEGMNGRGREAQVPALLDLYGVGYTFSDPLACATTLDKAVAKRLVREAGLATPAWFVVRDEADLSAPALAKLRFPLFAKPLAEGTGKGIAEASYAADPAALAATCRELLGRLREPVLVEEYLPGREFTVGLLGNGPRARALGTVEVAFNRPVERAIYSFENKHDYDDVVEYEALEPGPLRDAVERLALDAYLALECRDCSRADLRHDADGRPSFMEINPLPGLNAIHSDLPLIARYAGMTFADLVGGIIGAACERLGIAHA
jgi:D-alanine-D-alanine ligase